MTNVTGVLSKQDQAINTLEDFESKAKIAKIWAVVSIIFGLALVTTAVYVLPYVVIPLVAGKTTLTYTLGLATVICGLCGPLLGAIGFMQYRTSKDYNRSLLNLDHERLIDIQNGHVTQKTKDQFKRFGQYIKSLNLSSYENPPIELLVYCKSLSNLTVKDLTNELAQICCQKKLSKIIATKSTYTTNLPGYTYTSDGTFTKK